MPSFTKKVPHDSPLHRKLLKMIQTRIKFAKSTRPSIEEKWVKAENTILAYVPEADIDRARRTARENGEPQYTTIQLPYTYALLMAAHTYWTSVFFARSPVHQFSGRHGETEDQVQALEALIAYQIEVGEMLGPYYIWLYDVGKYGVGVLEESWEDEIIQFASIQEGVDELGNPIRQQIRAQMPGYQGNKVSNISPFDFYPDPRVPAGQFQRGEFCFVRKVLSWETIVRRIKQGYYIEENVKKLGADNSTKGTNSSSADSQLEKPEEWLSSFVGDEEVKHPSSVRAFEFYCSLIPSEWGLGDSDFPEKWVFTVTEDNSVLLGVQPHGAMHGRFPFALIESEVEAYGSWNRGIPEIIEPVQNTMDWLINQHFFNVRAALNNQFIIDPSKIVASDASQAGPGFRWRLRPEAYGQDIRTMIYQVPVQDVTRTHVSDMQTMLGIGERITGINDQILGVLSGGGRKTATEVRTSTGFGVNRLKTVTEYISATGMSQHAQRLVQNSQQYFSVDKKLRIAGPLLNAMSPNAAENFLNVTPDSIQGFYDFVPVDGSLPVDRLAQANLWKDILLQMRNVPGLVLQYDLGKIFSHVAHLAGIRNINQFRLQLGSPEALAQQADQGNLVPLRPGKGSGQTRPAQVPAASPL